MNYSLFVVFHSGLHEEIYKNKENFYLFAKVGDFPLKVNSELIKNQVIYADKLEGFLKKGAHWAESEFIFALYNTLKKNPNYLKTEYVGFTQYDHSCINMDETEYLIDYMNHFTQEVSHEKILSLVPIKTDYEIYENKIAMDFSDKEKQVGTPSCYFRMIKNYNDYYSTNYNFSDFYSMTSGYLPLCSSFVMSTKNFMEMMNYCSWATERDNLDEFDRERKWRAAGGFMERYYATWMILSKKKITNFQIKGLNRL